MGMTYSETMSYTATGEPCRHRLTVADYYRMGEAGILAPDARVEGEEILNGNTPHVELVELFTEHGAGTLIVR